MSQTPSVSVVLPVYNGERYLCEALESILSQTFRDFELIAINDGSKDSTGAILKAYADRDPRVISISRENRGLTYTLNEGIDRARGEFLARMDADDLSLPARFQLQVDYLRAHPDCVLVGSRVLLMDPEGLPIREMCQETSHAEIDSAHLNRGWPVVHPAVMMRTEAVRRVGSYRHEYDTLEDLDLFLRLAEVGQLANLPELLLRYRQHFASVTHSKVEQQNRIRQNIFAETYARRGLPMVQTTAAEPPPARRRYDQHSFWAWTALKAGNISTARKHAWATVSRKPWSFSAWRLMACALRGH